MRKHGTAMIDTFLREREWWRKNCNWGLCDVKENDDNKGWKDRENSEDVGNSFGLLSARINPVPAWALSMVLNQPPAPPLYLLCCRSFPLAAPLSLYLLYSPCHLPPSLPCKTPPMPVCFGMAPVDTEMSTRWMKVAAISHKAAENNTNNNTLWHQSEMRSVVRTCHSFFNSPLHSLCFIWFNIYLFIVIFIMDMSKAKSCSSLLLKSHENTSFRPLFAIYLELPCIWAKKHW